MSEPQKPTGKGSSRLKLYLIIFAIVFLLASGISASLVPHNGYSLSVLNYTKLGLMPTPAGEAYEIKLAFYLITPGDHPLKNGIVAFTSATSGFADLYPHPNFTQGADTMIGYFVFLDMSNATVGEVTAIGIKLTDSSGTLAQTSINVVFRESP